MFVAVKLRNRYEHIQSIGGRHRVQILRLKLCDVELLVSVKINMIDSFRFLFFILLK